MTALSALSEQLTAGDFTSIPVMCVLCSAMLTPVT